MTNVFSTSPKYLETLLLYHEEEIMGEAYFYGLADRFEAPRHREKLTLLARVERCAAESVRPLLVKYGLSSRPDFTLKEIGESWIERHEKPDWRALMNDMAERYPTYLDHFHALEEAAPEEDRAAIRVMAEHEVATIEFAKMEIAGDPRSIDLLQEYITPTGTQADRDS